MEVFFGKKKKKRSIIPKIMLLRRTAGQVIDYSNRRYGTCIKCDSIIRLM